MDPTLLDSLVFAQAIRKPPWLLSASFATEASEMDNRMPSAKELGMIRKKTSEVRFSSLIVLFTGFHMTNERIIGSPRHAHGTGSCHIWPAFFTNPQPGTTSSPEHRHFLVVQGGIITLAEAVSGELYQYTASCQSRGLGPSVDYNYRQVVSCLFVPLRSDALLQPPPHFPSATITAVHRMFLPPRPSCGSRAHFG